jgi:hypothetical protein
MTERDQAYLIERGMGLTWSITPHPGAGEALHR